MSERSKIWVKFKIKARDDRVNVLTALATNGYSVRVEELPEDEPDWKRDPYVLVEVPADAIDSLSISDDFYTK